MRTITADCFVDTMPMPDRTPAPISEVERFLAARAFDCIALSARISAEQCQANRANGLYLCGKCTQDKPAATGAKPTKRIKRHTGDNPESPWRSNPGFIPQAIRKDVVTSTGGVTPPVPKPAKPAAAAPAPKPAKQAKQPVQQVLTPAVPEPVKEVKKVAVKKSKPEKWTFTAEMDARIREVYRTNTGKNEVNRLATEFDYPRWAVSRRARDIGAYEPRIKEPNWTEAELTLLKKHAHKTPENIRKAFKSAGFDRSTTGIILKRRRLDMLHDLPAYSATALAGHFGVDIKCITGWIEFGWLKAEKRGTDRTAAQGGDMWYILKADVQRFILDSIGVIDIRKVDKFWLLDQIATGVATDISSICRAYAAGIGIHQAAVAVTEIDDRIRRKYLTAGVL